MSARSHAHLGQIAEDISNNSHRRFWWKDVRVADHELFKNVILNCSSQFCLFCSLTTKQKFYSKLRQKTEYHSYLNTVWHIQHNNKLSYL